MKTVVVGLGAVGGLIAARLSAAGLPVCALARGATLAAVRERGLRLTRDSKELAAPIRVASDARELGPHDLVIVALKGPALIEAAPTLRPLLHAQTVVLPAMNGVPWWFLQVAAPAAGADAGPLRSVDPDGRIGATLPLAQVLGCVVHLTCSSPEPGVVAHGFGNRLIVGEPSGGASARTAAVCELLARAGFAAEASTDIRSDIWYKLWGNMTTNPISALTGATTDRILDDPLVQAFMLRAMAEAAAIGARIGCPIAQSGEERVVVTRQLGGFKTSMLQDALAGRTLEIDALVGAAHEIGARVGIDAPNIGALLGLTRLMARERGLYPRESAAPAGI
ncbi:MAG: 2-dehydropantoate 2-reductase [Caldimonas sp.]